MTVFYGQVSHKNGLGQTRMVAATDDYNFAQAYGVDGLPGGTTSNQKVNMLDLNPDAGHSIVAVDPAEMQSISNFEYLRNHVSSVVDWGQMATALENSNAGALQNALAQIEPNADLSTLANQSRGLLAQYLVGATDAQTVRESLDSQSPFEMLTDSLKRLNPRLTNTTEGIAGGVDFTLMAHGTSAVQLAQAGDAVGQVILPFKVRGQVLGSASRAGSAYKPSFVKIRQAVTKVAIEDYRVDVRFDVHAKLSAVVQAAQMKMQQTQLLVLNQLRANLEQQFADLGNYNPASAKARLWSELGITNSDIPQTNLDDIALRQYAAGRITAEEFASMPANHMVPRLNQAIQARFFNADKDAIVETAIDNIRDDHPVDAEHLPAVKAYGVQQLPKYLDQVFNKVGHNSNFADAMYWYHASNQMYMSQILPLIEHDLADYIDNQLPEMQNEPASQTNADGTPEDQLADLHAQTAQQLAKITSLDSMQDDSVKQKIIDFLKQDSWTADGTFVNDAMQKTALYWAAKVAAMVAFNADQLHGQLEDIIKQTQTRMQQAHDEYASQVRNNKHADQASRQQALAELKKSQEQIDNLMPQSPDEWAEFIADKVVESQGDKIIDYYHQWLATDTITTKDRIKPHIDDYVTDDAQADAVRDTLQTMSVPDFVQAIADAYPDTQACIQAILAFAGNGVLKSPDSNLDQRVDGGMTSQDEDAQNELDNQVDQFFQNYGLNNFVPLLVATMSDMLGGAAQYQNELHDTIETAWEQEIADEVEADYVADLHFTADNYRPLIAQTLKNNLDSILQEVNAKMDWTGVHNAVLDNLADMLQMPAVRTVDDNTWQAFAQQWIDEVSRIVDGLDVNSADSQFYFNVSDNYALLDHLDPDWQDDVADFQ